MIEVQGRSVKERKIKEIQLTDPTSGVCGGPVDLGKVLSGEGASTVSSPSTIGVDDYLTTGETGITLRPANDKPSRWLNLLNMDGCQCSGKLEVRAGFY